MTITGQRLRTLRTSLKLSQEKFGELVGISRVYVSKLEAGEIDRKINRPSRINVELAKKIATVINEKILSEEFGATYTSCIRWQWLVYDEDSQQYYQDNYFSDTVRREYEARQAAAKVLVAAAMERMYASDYFLPTISEGQPLAPPVTKFWRINPDSIDQYENYESAIELTEIKMNDLIQKVQEYAADIICSSIADQEFDKKWEKTREALTNGKH